MPTNFDRNTLTLPNGTAANIPMSGKQTVTVTEGYNQPFEVEVVRTMAKVEFLFSNLCEADDIEVQEIVFDPLTTSPVYLLPQEVVNPSFGYDAALSMPTGTTAGAYTIDLSAAPISLTHGQAAVSTSHICYVNETDFSKTPVQNEYLVRVKVKRASAEKPEYRYALTTKSWTEGDVTQYMRNINRNDWIKIPIKFTDYLLRVEALSYTPIGGYPAHQVDADDDHTTRFSTGGTFCISCHLKKYGTASWMRLNEYPVTSYTITTAGDDIFTDGGTPSLVSTGEIIGNLDDSQHGTATVTLTAPINDGTLIDVPFTYHIYIIRE